MLITEMTESVLWYTHIYSVTHYYFHVCKSTNYAISDHGAQLSFAVQQNVTIKYQHTKMQ